MILACFTLSLALCTVVAEPTAPQDAAPAGSGAAASSPRVRPAIYDESADAAKQIAAALEQARRENRRVLVQWGGNWCPWCIRLHELSASDAEIARTLKYEYDVVLVDTGRPPGKNVELAKSFGADVANHGYPFLTVLDATGKALANQETESLERKDEKGESAGIASGHDPAKVLAFLREHQSAPQVAADLLDASLREAKSSGRRVLVHYGAPWCPWCLKLDDWLRSPEIAPIVARSFVDLKIDVDRMIGGKELFARHRPSGEQGGIPWFAILDAQGTILATSTMPDGGNTGFPAAEAEIAHFAAMLERTAPALTAQERGALLESLRAIERVRKAKSEAPAAAATPPLLTEDQKIDRLIAHIEELRGATFIRNGDEHAAADAAAHLRRKLGAQRSSIRTAEDFIRLCGTKSSVSGDVYLIRFEDGREVECAVHLREQLGAMSGGSSAAGGNR